MGCIACLGNVCLDYEMFLGWGCIYGPGGKGYFSVIVMSGAFELLSCHMSCLYAPVDHISRR